jgi:hypothetical protein
MVAGCTGLGVFFGLCREHYVDAHDEIFSAVDLLWRDEYNPRKHTIQDELAPWNKCHEIGG